jgi:hypothetical protein
MGYQLSNVSDILHGYWKFAGLCTSARKRTVAFCYTLYRLILHPLFRSPFTSSYNPAVQLDHVIPHPLLQFLPVYSPISSSPTCQSAILLPLLHLPDRALHYASPYIPRSLPSDLSHRPSHSACLPIACVPRRLETLGSRHNSASPRICTAFLGRPCRVSARHRRRQHYRSR